MKKILILILFLSTIFLFKSNVQAESFVESNYINGEFINKVKDNKTYYMTMQFIKDSKGRIVYCLEPFVDFKTGQSYEEYEGDLSGYANLTKEQKREIELIIYYGYGYGNRVEDKWYVITQYLIWKVVDENANIYFTKTLNGSKIDKYINEINEIKTNVEKHDIKPSFLNDYNVDYGKSLIIRELNNDYEIVDANIDYYKNENGFQIDVVHESGKIGFRKISNYYENKVMIFDSANSQDLIRPGNVEEQVYNFNINVKKGRITVDIRKVEDVYTIESSLKDTCYEIRNENDIFVDKICTGDEYLVYTTDDLPYGEYSIEQVSVGIGYKKDDNLYKVTISDKDINPYIILNNLLIKNFIDIVKYECIGDECLFEEGAIFKVVDKNGDNVCDLITDKEGFTFCEVGYGTYDVSQIKGKDGYTLVDSYKEKIVDEDTMHRRELYDYLIKEEVEIPSNIFNEIPDVYEEVRPPDTKIDFIRYDIILGSLFLIIFMIKKIT